MLTDVLEIDPKFNVTKFHSNLFNYYMIKDETLENLPFF